MLGGRVVDDLGRRRGRRVAARSHAGEADGAGGEHGGWGVELWYADKHKHKAIGTVSVSASW